MVYSETSLGNVSILPDLERLEEPTTNMVSMITVRESKMKHTNLVSLEEVTKFMQDNSLSLKETVERIAKTNDIHMYSLGFSVFPSNLMEDMKVYENALILKEEGFNIYTTYNPGSVLAECFDMAIAEGLKENNTELFDQIVDILDEGAWKNFTNNVINPGIEKSLKHQTANVLGSVGHVVANGAREGAAKAGENIINRHVFGAMFNKNQQDPLGSGERISSFDAAVRRNVPNQDVADFITTTAKGSASAVSKSLINKVMEFLRFGGSQADGQQVLNQLQHQTAVMGSRIGTTNDPRTRNLLQRMYDKLKALKDKIIARIRGQKVQTA